MKARISEIFSSIQGEGPYVGRRQIFVRFDNCNMSCSFCDTIPQKGSREYSVEELSACIKDLNKTSPHHSISLTGGEPLLQVDFLKTFLPTIKDLGFKIYLETNATLPEGLKEILDFIDIVAMDIKLPSSAGCEAFWQEHSEFLELSRGKEVFVKVVVTENTKDEDFINAVNLVRQCSREAAFVIQPVTASGTAKEISPARLLEYQKLAGQELKDVRVIPQLHKLIGVR